MAIESSSHTTHHHRHPCEAQRRRRRRRFPNDGNGKGEQKNPVLIRNEPASSSVLVSSSSGSWKSLLWRLAAATTVLGCAATVAAAAHPHELANANSNSNGNANSNSNSNGNSIGNSNANGHGNGHGNGNANANANQNNGSNNGNGSQLRANNQQHNQQQRVSFVRQQQQRQEHRKEHHHQQQQHQQQQQQQHHQHQHQHQHQHHQQQQQHQQQKASVPTENDEPSQIMRQHQQEHNDFLEWCWLYWGIDTSKVEIDFFEYPDYIRAMEDRIDVFCEDCHDDEDLDEDFDDRDASEGGSSLSSSDKNNSIDKNNSQSNYGNHLHDYDSYSLRSLYHDQFDGDRFLTVWDEYPPIAVRGLKASRDLVQGEVVVSIPHGALWTVYNVIDGSDDEFLKAALGMKSRSQYDWWDETDSASSEIPLLAVTLLYRKMRQQQQEKAPNESHPSYNYVRPYLDVLALTNDPETLRDRIPHLWSSRQLRTAATANVRTIAKGIRKDVLEWYQELVVPLIRRYPEVFGPPTNISSGNSSNSSNNSSNNNSNNNNNNSSNIDTELGENNSPEEWMFSLENFHWAFALVNSRHWHLPIPDVHESDRLGHDSAETEAEAQAPTTNSTSTSTAAAAAAATTNSSREHPNGDSSTDSAIDDPHQQPVVDSATTFVDDDHKSYADQEGPPAATPTDEWVFIRDQKLRDEEAREWTKNSGDEDPDFASKNNSKAEETWENNNNKDQSKDDGDWGPPGTSFLVPLADLLNFGPPCTRGIYNVTTNTFDIVATCNISKGQEITFWYTDACRDVVMANYGFTAPMMIHNCEEESDDIDGEDASYDADADSDADASFSNQSESSSSIGKDSQSDHFTQEQMQQEQDYEYLEQELFHAYEELDRLDYHVNMLLKVMEECHCENQTRLATTKTSSTEERSHRKATPVDEQGQSFASAPLPGSPSPRPIRETSTASTGTSQSGAATGDGRSTHDSARGGPQQAPHAIRDGSNGSSGNTMRRKTISPTQGQTQNRSNGGRGRGQQPPAPHHRRHPHTRTRTRSRRHQSRKLEF